MKKKKQRYFQFFFLKILLLFIALSAIFHLYRLFCCLMSAYVVFPSTNSGWITQEEYTSVCSIKLVRSCTLIIATISGLLSIVVRRGSQILAYSELLYPVTATSSGTRSPARNAAFTAPVAVMSSPQTMAVNFLFSAISFSTASIPPPILLSVFNHILLRVTNTVTFQCFYKPFTF